MSPTENPEPSQQSPKPKIGKNPPAGKDTEPKLCHVHVNVGWWSIDTIRQNVCVNDEDLIEHTDGKYYCLFHLPSTDKKNFEEKLEERLAEIEKRISDTEQLHQQKRESTLREIMYDFSYVYFPSFANFFEYKFTSDASFKSATFTSDANFSGATFTSSVSFDSAKFTSGAYFSMAKFTSYAYFSGAKFTSYASFNSATFTLKADFISPTFTSYADFRSATFSGDANFRSTTFSGDANFKFAKFEEKGSANFNYANFAGETIFDETEFNNRVGFYSAVFGSESNVFFRETVFNGVANFNYCTAEGYLRFSGLAQGAENKFDFQEAAFEKASRVSFHTVRLYPNWFVNIDSRKFVFTGIDWKNYNSDFRNKNIKAELKSLEGRVNEGSEKGLLEIACRQLAVNAEENNRYEEASKFRYMAMETRRLENKGGWRVVNLHWFYK